MSGRGGLSGVLFRVEYRAFGETWLPMGDPVSYADAQKTLSFLRGADEPMEVRARVVWA